MDMRRLEIFYRVVKEGGFTRAADAMSLSQPTLSAAVRQLETDLDAQLLSRLGRSIEPTPAGQVLYGYAHRIFALRREAKDNLDSLRSGEQGELLLGGSTIPGTYILPQFVAAFSRKFPKVRVRLQLASTENIIRALRQRRLELALVGGKVSDRNLEAIPCFSDELLVVCPPGHRWSKRQSIEEGELVDCSLLLRESGSATRSALEVRLAEHGFKLMPDRIVAEVGGNEALKQGVMAGLGVAVISRRAIEGDLTRGELIGLPLAGGALKRIFYLLSLKSSGVSVVAERFKEELIKASCPESPAG